MQLLQHFHFGACSGHYGFKSELNPKALEREKCDNLLFGGLHLLGDVAENEEQAETNSESSSLHHFCSF